VPQSPPCTSLSLITISLSVAPCPTDPPQCVLVLSAHPLTTCFPKELQKTPATKLDILSLSLSLRLSLYNCLHLLAVSICIILYLYLGKSLSLSHLYVYVSFPTSLAICISVYETLSPSIYLCPISLLFPRLTGSPSLPLSLSVALSVCLSLCVSISLYMSPSSSPYPLTGIAFIAYMILGMLSIRLVSLPMYSTLRRTTVVVVLVLDYLISR